MQSGRRRAHWRSVAPDKFKDYDTLRSRLDSVLGVVECLALVLKRISTLRSETVKPASDEEVLRRLEESAKAKHERLNLPPLLMRKTR